MDFLWGALALMMASAGGYAVGREHTRIEMDREVIDANTRARRSEATLSEVRIAWGEHQKTKFKSDGSHFQADLKLNSLLLGRQT